MNSDDRKKVVGNEDKISAAIKLACESSFGVLKTNFMCHSLSILEPPEPLCLTEDATLLDAIQLLQTNKIGSVLIVNQQGVLIGIFTERDCILKVLGHNIDLASTPVKDLMTPDPVVEKIDSSIAFALNLMSEGGFRHLPLVDERNIPIGVISVKDVIDHITKSFTQSLLDFEVSE